MSRKLRVLSLLLILLGMGGCVHGSTDRPAAVSDYCRIAKPIFYDTTKDTAETVKGVEAHNSQWACVCESDCPRRGPEGMAG